MSDVRASSDPRLRVPPGWTWAALGLAHLAFLPLAVAIGNWRWTPTTGPALFSLAVVVVTIEAWASSDYRHRQADEERWRYQRGVELLLLGLVAITIAVAGRPWTQLRPDRLLGPELWTCVAVVFGVWLTVTVVYRDLAVLAGRGRLDVGQQDPFERLTRRALLVGLLVTLAVSLGEVPWGPVALIAYIVLATASLARARFADLERRWRRHEATVGAEVAPRFRALVAGLVAVVTLAAVALPTPTWVGPVILTATLRRIGMWLDWRFTWLYEDFLGWEEPDEPQEPIDPLEGLEEAWGTPTPEGVPFDTPEPLPWMDPYWAMFGWFLGAAAALTIIVLYLRERPQLRQALRIGTIRQRLRNPLATFTAIVGALRSLAVTCWSLLRSMLRAVGSTATRQTSPTRGGGIATTATEPSKATSASSQTRLRILSAYRELLDEAREHGRGRRPPQTPLEYETELAQHLTGGNSELRRVSNAFVLARYSARPIDAELARDVEGAVHTLRRQLRDDPRQAQADLREEGSDFH